MPHAAFSAYLHQPLGGEASERFHYQGIGWAYFTPDACSLQSRSQCGSSCGCAQSGQAAERSKPVEPTQRQNCHTPKCRFLSHVAGSGIFIVSVELCPPAASFSTGCESGGDKKLAAYDCKMRSELCPMSIFGNQLENIPPNSRPSRRWRSHQTAICRPILPVERRSCTDHPKRAAAAI